MKRALFAILRLTLVGFGRLMGAIIGRLWRARRRIAKRNIARCLSQKNRYLIDCMFSLQGQMVMELIVSPLYEWYKKYLHISWVGEKYFEWVCVQKRPIIFVTGHVGNWEIGAHLLAERGVRSVIPYKPFKTFSWLNTLVKRSRERTGNTLVSAHVGVRPLLKALRNNQSVILITDQYCQPHHGVYVELFGQQTWAHRTFAQLAYKTKALVVPIYILTTGLFSYEVQCGVPIDAAQYASEEFAIQSLVHHYVQSLEQVVKKKPEQWLWQHRRFKNGAHR